MVYHIYGICIILVTGFYENNPGLNLIFSQKHLLNLRNHNL